MIDDAQRLARYDALYADLCTQRERVIMRMDELKLEGKTKTATYQQLLVNKLELQNIIGKFEIYGLERPSEKS